MLLPHINERSFAMFPDRGDPANNFLFPCLIPIDLCDCAVSVLPQKQTLILGVEIMDADCWGEMRVFLRHCLQPRFIVRDLFRRLTVRNTKTHSFAQQFGCAKLQSRDGQPGEQSADHLYFNNG